MSGTDERQASRASASQSSAEEKENDVHRGLIPRSIAYLFRGLQRGASAVAQATATPAFGTGKMGAWSLKANYLEIYNEQLRDLLAPDVAVQAVPGWGGKKGDVNGVGGGDIVPPPQRPLPLRQSPDGAFFADGCVERECHSVEDVLAVAQEAQRNRVVRAHALNQDSSRSHAIFILQIEREMMVPASTSKEQSAADGSGGNNDPAVPLVPTMRYGKLIFVDLAGSENLKQSKSSGADAMAETCAINKSLFTLGAVISLLSDMAKGKKAPGTHVPFRNSVLTKLLAESLAGRGMAMMLACVSPSSMHASETLRTLMYADRARNIRTKPTINNALINHNKDELIFALRRDVKQLTMENGILRALLQQHNIPLPDVEALVRARVLREGGGGAVSNLLGGGGRGSALATGRRPGGEVGSGESEWLRLNSRGGTAHKSSANLLSPGSVAAAAAAADGAMSPVDSARGSALDAAMALASGNNNRRSKRAAGTRSSMGEGAGGRHPIHHSIGGGGGGGGAAGGGSAFEPLTGQETLEELRQALLDARAFIDDHMQSEGGGGNLFSSPTGDSSSSSPGQMAKKKGSKARQQYQQQGVGGGFEDDSSDHGLRAAFGKGGGGVGGGASGDVSSDNDGGSGNSSGPGSLANSQKSKNKRLEVDPTNALLHPSALSSQVSSGMPSGRDGGLVVDTFTSDVDDDAVEANMTPRSLRASNRSLRATIASLRRTVALLETGPAVGKDLSDDYDCLSPNKRKAVSELFALKKNNVRLMKQVMQANQIVKEAEEREKRLEDELTRLRKAVADDKVAAAAAAASSTLPVASIPLLPHGGRADGDRAFVHGSMGMVLPGGARPTLSLSIPAPGAPSAKVRGPDPPPATSSLTTSSSAALSVSHSHPSVTTTSSPYTPSAAGAAVSPRVLPHYAQQPLRTHYPPPPQHVPYAAPSYSGGAAGGFPQQVQIPVGVVGGAPGGGGGNNSSSTSSFQPSPSQSPIFVPSPEQPPRSLQNSASMRRLQTQQQQQLQQLQQAQPTGKQSMPSSANTKKGKAAAPAAAAVPAPATALSTSVDAPVSSRHEHSEADSAVADPAAVEDAAAAAATEEAEAAALAADADRRADEADAAAETDADAAAGAAVGAGDDADAEFDAEAEAEAAEQAEVDAQLREDDAALDALSMDAAQMDEAMQGHSGEAEEAAAAQQQQEGEEDGDGDGEAEDDDAAAAVAATDADADAEADGAGAEEEEADADAGGEEDAADADGEAEADAAAADADSSAADDAADEDGAAAAEANDGAAAAADGAAPEAAAEE
jgi:hypothetical protein